MNSDKLYQMAYSFLGRDASPRDTAPDFLACAESVQAVYLKTFGKSIGGGNSTHEMWKALEVSPSFEKVTEPVPGCIIISPTGTNPESNPIRHGHCGITGKFHVMSNDSFTGNWSTHFTQETWKDYYGDKGEFPIYYFKPI